MSEYFGHYGKHVSVLPCSLGIQSVLLAPCQNYLWLYKRYLWPLECSQPRAGQAGHVRELKPWEAVLHQLQMGFVRKIPQVSQLSVRTDLKCFPPAGLRSSAGISYLFISIPSGFLHLPALSPHSAVTASWGHFSQINSLHSQGVFLCRLYWKLLPYIPKFDYWNDLNCFIKSFFLSFPLPTLLHYSFYSPAFQGYIAPFYRVKFFGKMYKDYHQLRNNA